MSTNQSSADYGDLGQKGSITLKHVWGHMTLKLSGFSGSIWDSKCKSNMDLISSQSWLLRYQIDQILLLTDLITFYTNKDYWWDAFFRNNDGFITKQEMLNATKKLTEKQVKLQTLSVKILLIDIWLYNKRLAQYSLEMTRMVMENYPRKNSKIWCSGKKRRPSFFHVSNDSFIIKLFQTL